MTKCIKCKCELPQGASFCPSCGKRQTAPPRKTMKRPNGTGTVFKKNERRKKPWCAERSGVTIGYFATKAEALDVLERTKGMELGEYYNATFAQVYELWQAEHFRELTPKGVEQYKAAYKHCAPLYGLKFRTIKLAQYQQIIDTMAAKGLSRSTCNKVKQLFGQMCRWAMREDVITKNYATFVKLPEEEKKEKEIFTAEDIAKLWKASADENVQTILIMIYTGVRIGELFTIEKANVNIAEGYMIGGSKTEAGKDRIIPIKATVAPFVKAMYDKAPDGGLLVQGRTGTQRVDHFRNRQYYPTLERLGIPKRNPHCCRHTFASMMAKAGVRPEVLQKILGHADYSTTANVYVHTDLAELTRAVASI